jgi:endonuclease/exonuclease/phosphatase family metal-dependent hydrolase
MTDLSNKVEVLDKNTQEFLKDKYKVTFYDSLPEKVNRSMNDSPIIQRINRMYQGELLRELNVPLYNYDPFLKYEEKTGAHFNTLDIGKINTNNYISLDVKKGEYIFKGTRDFITTELEEKFLKKTDSIQPYWFGSGLVGYMYSKTYKGGLNAYKFKNDSKLFVINDTRNEKTLINAVNNLTDSEVKTIGHSKRDILDSLRVKYGYDCNIGYQIKYIERYTGYPDLWMSRYIDKELYMPEVIKYRNKRVFGAGKLDRVCGRFMCLFCHKNNFIGYCSLYNYTVFYALGILGDEIVICDQTANIERDTNHKLDWYQWKKYIPVDFDNDVFTNYTFNPIFHSKKFLGVFKQYSENQLDNKRNNDILNIIKKSKPVYKFITLNLHGFVSSNLNDTFEIVVNKLNELLNKFNIDFCFLEEFQSYVNDDYIENIFVKYNILKSPNLGSKGGKYFGNVLLSKDKINKYNFIELSNNKNMKRMATIFQIDNKNVEHIKFCGTHLDIGDRYTERSGTFKSHQQIIDTFNSNSNKRILELNKIINNSPDILLGDLNFTKEDPEFEHLSRVYNDTMKEEYPTLFNNERVDFIFGKKSIKCDSYVVSYPYSDHLPVLGLIY